MINNVYVGMEIFSSSAGRLPLHWMLLSHLRKFKIKV